ncbi:hypothetical protein KC901_01440 [Patescibacteria group bacterium]|nr:hypothetical protein [Patescibacteria group bacterium]MCA9352825.1 hypothetical protein [Patescibacteria group bacterium]
MTKDTQKRILDIINERQVTPLPRWYFVLKQTFIWLGIVTSCFIASFLVALLVFQVGNFGMLPPHRAPLFILVTGIALAIFIGLAIYQVKQTKNAYRRQTWKYIAGILALSFILGVVFFSVRLHERFERTFPRGARLIGGIATIEEFWVDPASGLLAGTITAYEPEGDTLSLTVFDGDEYVISLDEVLVTDRRALDVYNEIRLVGYATGDDMFHACSIAPWVLRGGPERPPLRTTWQPPRRPLRDGSPAMQLNPRETFIKFFETKSEIVRSNECQ